MLGMKFLDFLAKAKSPNTFVFSDIHGCAKEFELLLEQLPLNKNSRLVFLGDYIDRGPDSAKVVQRIIDLKKTFEIITLMGNHERMFLDFLANKESEESSLFSINGGTATLASYNPDNKGYQIPEDHLEFYKQLKFFHVEDQYIFVHAGLPDIEARHFDEYSNPIEFLWVRDKFYNSSYSWGRPVIHGHTPIPECYLSERRINIDTGCVFGHKLTALELPSQKIYQVKREVPSKDVYYKVEGSARRSERFKISLPVVLRKDKKSYKCKAVDFSATGAMLMVELQSELPPYNLENAIKGIIGIKNKEIMSFEGKVKRILKNENALFYGIEFSEPPKDAS
jgi:serine/threonine protein phosphatase 1